MSKKISSWWREWRARLGRARGRLISFSPNSAKISSATQSSASRSNDVGTDISGRRANTFEASGQNQTAKWYFWSATVWSLTSLFLLFGLLLATFSQEIISWWLPAKQPTQTENNTGQTSLTIDVSGAVVSPGIYELPVGSRWAAAVAAAQGFASGVDQAKLNQQINLAQVVEDGQKIYIPFLDESENDQPDVDSSDQSTASGGDNQLVSINSASVTALDQLPGIGRTRAEAIVSGRPYQEINQLVSKEIISEAIYKQIVGLIKL